MDTEELIKENESLKNRIDELEKSESKLESDLSENQSELRSERRENEELRERIDDLEWSENLSKKFNEIFEFYNCIWSDETKDQQLLEAMKKLHWNQRNE